MDIKLTAINQNDFNLTFNDSIKYFGGVSIGFEFGDRDPMHVTDDLFDPNNLTFSPSLTIFIAIVAMLMSMITIIGNVFVITAFIIEKGLRKYSNYFILNLSIADLLIGILIPPYAPFLLYKRHWKIGRVACTIWLVLDYVVGSASVLCIVVISLDRYLLVSRGLNYVASQKISKAICIMITVWAIAFLNYAPAIVFWEFISGRRTVKDGECQVEFHDNLVYLTATACVEFFVPLISICTLNLAVYLNIRKRSRGLIRSENPKFNLDKSTVASPAKNASIRIATNMTTSDLQKNPINVKETVFSNKPQSTDLNRIDEIKEKKVQQHIPDENDRNHNKISTSSSSSSISSLDDQPVIKIKRSLKDKTIINEDVSLLDDKSNKSNRKKSVTHIMVKQANETLGVNLTSTQIATKNLSKINSKQNNPAHNKASRSALTKDKKAARSLFILVFVFVFCWAPYTFLTLIKAVCPSCVDDSIYELAFWLLWFNSTFNPILYPFLHVKFRKAFLKIIHFILFCFKFKKRRSFKTDSRSKLNR